MNLSEGIITENLLSQNHFYKPIYGHEKNERLLRDWIEQDCLPPVLMFYGANGVGKCSVAMKLAYSIVTSSAYGVKCGTSELDASVHNCVHPDLQIIAVASLDELRTEVSRMCHLPVLAPKRVVIFKNIHQYSKLLSNSLLKLIEEPPLRTQIIMLSDDINLVLPTIRSRCIRMCFYPLNIDVLKQVFRDKNAIGEVLLAGSSIGHVYALQSSNALEVYKTILREFSTANVSNLATMLAALDIEVVSILIHRIMHIIISQCSENFIELLPEEMAFVRGKSFDVDMLSEMYQKIYVYRLYQLYNPAIYYYFFDMLCKNMHKL